MQDLAFIPISRLCDVHYQRAPPSAANFARSGRTHILQVESESQRIFELRSGFLAILFALQCARGVMKAAVDLRAAISFLTRKGQNTISKNPYKSKISIVNVACGQYIADQLGKYLAYASERPITAAHTLWPVSLPDTDSKACHSTRLDLMSLKKEKEAKPNRNRFWVASKTLVRLRKQNSEPIALNALHTTATPTTKMIHQHSAPDCVSYTLHS